jgi:hypothetical protein
VTDEDYNAVFNLPFAEASSYFQQKLNIPTAKWNDLWKEEHAKGFMSAGAEKADLLSDLHAEVAKGIAGGLTREEFLGKFDEIVAKHGWSYNGNRQWRSNLIYDTNVTTAYQAGRWQQFTEGGAKFLKYIHADGVRHPRPQHVVWNGLTLPITHDFWKSHYPPNGWRCHCRCVRADAHEVTPQPQRWQEVDPKTDTMVGIDKGWDYNVGQAGMLSHETVLGEKMAKMTPEMRKASFGELASRVTPVRDWAFARWGEAVMENINAETGLVKTVGQFVAVHQIEPVIFDKLISIGELPETTAIGISDSDWLHLMHNEQPLESKRPAGKRLSKEDALKIPEFIRDSRIFWDQYENKLLYVFEVDRIGKAVVEINFGQRGKITNSIKTVGWMNGGDIVAGKRYKPLND